MLTETQIKEIREHLENARNPIFFYDNDPDGFCSFILLRRYCGKGRGVIIKSNPGLDKNYFKKVEEFNADYIFVVDKPIIDKEFIEKVEEKKLPLVHIDHHNVPNSGAEFYYNTFTTSGKNEPVSYLCQKIANRKEDIWISAIGCITDAYLPDFLDSIKERTPELIEVKYKSAFDILYRTTLGKISMIISFAMKDKISNVVAMTKFMFNVSNPSELLEENPKTSSFLKRFEYINEKYLKLLKKAENSVKEDTIFFTYSGELSISQYIANQLFYENPHKAVIVVYTKGNISNISLRWEKDIRTATVNAIKDIEGASGGGHEHASGARMAADKLEEFKKKLLEEIKKN